MDRESIFDKVREEIGKLKPEPLGHINYEGIQHQALPLVGSVGEVWLLRPDGSFWKADADFGLPLEPLPQRLHTIALVAGAKRYPWLKELLPERPFGAVDCRVCGGTGRMGPGAVAFCHTCDALGWTKS